MRRTTALRSSVLTFALLAPLSVIGPAQGEDLFDAAGSGPAEGDQPGTRYLIRPDELPPPVMTGDPEEPDFENAPTLVDGPPGVEPQVPEGFEVEVFDRGLNMPRVLRVAPNGDLFISETGEGRVLVYPGSNPTDEPAVFASGLNQPFGIAFYPADDPEYVYVGAADRVVRYPYRAGDHTARGPAEVILDDLPFERHWTKDLAVAPDGEHLFVSVGSASNVAGGMSDMPPGGIEDWEEEHGRGAAWDDETDRAVVRVFDPEGDHVRNYATGLRNCSGMTVQPHSGDLWCTGNERDHLGADVVPDHLTRVQDGGFYGWPWYYTGGHEDPAHAGERPDLQDEVITPDVLIQAHSSTMQMVFYDHEAFPRQYHGDAFATLRGSWNREHRTGYKVVRAIMVNGEPTGIYEDFMTGFVLDEERVWGRPTGLVVTHDGDLLVSDDANGTVFRVSAETQPPPPAQRYGFFLTNDWDGGDADVTFMYGRFTDEVLIGDWDGDGTDSITVRRGNRFYVNNHPTGGPAQEVFDYGRAGDTVLVGDWDGDGTDTLAVRRGNVYHVKNSLSGGPADHVIGYGRAGDEVLVGDWDGDSRDTFAVRRGATYYVKNTMAGGNADVVFTYGRPADVTLAGDWDGDGHDTFAVRRGNVYHLNNALRGGQADLTVAYGRAGDEVYVGDWDGDHTDTLGVRRVP